MPGYKNCTLCPRQCGVDRTAGQTGFCRMPAQVRVARSAPHFWEEPVISGVRGSGAVFFSGCTLGCGFCQNSEISHGGAGRPVTSAQLRKMLEELVSQGVHNVELVTASHFLPDILPALSPKLPVPVVYNCGGYERPETLRLLEGAVDVYLPDMKFSDDALAARVAGAGDYTAVNRAAVLEMYRQTGPAVYENGLMVRGVLVRHLVLPGHVDNSLGVLVWLADNFPPGAVPVSLMCQYTPLGPLSATPPFDRRVTPDEYAAVRSWMELCGIREGFCQSPEASDAAFVPDFDMKF